MNTPHLVQVAKWVGQVGFQVHSGSCRKPMVGTLILENYRE